MNELPKGWGLLEQHGRTVKRVHGGPKGNIWWTGVPFRECNKRAETRMLVSALAQPEARPKPPAIPRKGIDVSAWIAPATAQQEPTNG